MYYSPRVDLIILFSLTEVINVVLVLNIVFQREGNQMLLGSLWLYVYQSDISCECLDSGFKSWDSTDSENVLLRYINYVN